MFPVSGQYMETDTEKSRGPRLPGTDRVHVRYRAVFEAGAGLAGKTILKVAKLLSFYVAGRGAAVPGHRGGREIQWG